MFKYLRVFPKWECIGGWGKGQHHRIFIKNYMWIMYIQINPVDNMNMLSEGTPGICNFYNSTSDFLLYLYLKDL